MALSPTESRLRRTGILASGRLGTRTGIGTYINYLLGATLLAATAVGVSLARGRTRADRSAPEPKSRPEEGATTQEKVE
jgi:hypothetical protein